MVKTWLLGAAMAVGLVGLVGLTTCAVTDPGTGTQTLVLTMSMSYLGNGPDRTAVNITTLTKAGLDVINPNILVRDGVTGGGYPVGPKVGVIEGYHRNVLVQVTAGVDALSCKLEGPSSFTVSQPLQAQSHSLKEDLQITWQTPDGVHADRVEIHLKNANVSNTLQNDDGFYNIPAALLRPGDETVTVVRTTSVVPAGAAGGSLIEMKYIVSVDFRVQ